MDRTANTPPLHLSWCSWAEREVPASHSEGILPPLRDKWGMVAMETTNIMGYFGTGNEKKTYRHSLSCSSGAFVQEDTHTRNCPVCSRSHIHSSHYWCCTRQYLLRTDVSLSIKMWIFFLTIGWYWDWELTATVCEAIETVTFVAHTLKASRVVDADVVTCSLKGTLVNICRGQKHTSNHLCFLISWLAVKITPQ